jgi:hypothetical protein
MLIISADMTGLSGRHLASHNETTQFAAVRHDRVRPARAATAKRRLPPDEPPGTGLKAITL